MSEDRPETDQPPTRSEAGRLKAYRKRMLLLGLGILILSLLVGVGVSFYQWDHGSPFDASNWGNHNPIGRATYGPLLFTLMIFPITLPAWLILAVPVYFGLKKPRLWPLALLPFVVLGVLWVFWITELWKMD